MKAKISTNFAGIATITTKGTSMKTMVALVLAFAALAALILNSIPAPAFAAILKDSRDYAANRNFDIKGAGIDDNGDPYIQVYGDAGGTTSDTTGIILAYVFVTDARIYAVTIASSYRWLVKAWLAPLRKQATIRTSVYFI